MKQVVIMPGGFHPFHAGHYALYKQAQDAFPGADVYVAATNDTSARPFPFAVKEKLAKLAGVAPGHFVQVKSPFQAREITANLDPANTQLIFVRSEKDANKPPQAGGVKKDGNPAYLQPLEGQDDLAPMAQHAYMAYLPTVEFGPGMTSATEIRTAWPRLNEKRKTALVMSLYPKTQTNPALAANVVKLLDAAMGGELDEAISRRGFLKGAGAVAAAGATGKASAIAGAFPTPSQSAAMYKAAADSNRAEAKRQAELKVKADAERLQKNTELVDKEQRVNHHSLKVDEAGFDKEEFRRHMRDLEAREELRKTDPVSAKALDLRGQLPQQSKKKPDDDSISINDPRHPSYAYTQAGQHKLDEFAPGNGDDGLPQAEYEVYQCNLDDQFEWIGGPLMQTDDLAKAHSFAYFLWKKHPNKCFMIWQERSQGSRGGYGPKGSVLAPSDEELNEFAPDEGGGSRKFIPWPEFIEQVKQIVGKDFDCVENVVKTTIKARFVPHDPMEFGPTMLYSYYETRAGGRNKGAVSTRGAIQVGKYTGGGFTGQIKGKLLTTFSLLKGHPFERHFDLTFDNIYKIANIIMGNTQGALEFKPEGVAEGVASDDRPEHQLHTELVYNHGADKIKLQYERDGDANKLIANIQKIAKLQHGMDIDADTAKWIAGDLVYPDILEQGEAGPVEAYGYVYDRRDQRVMWRKTFPSAEAAYAWADSKNATVLGTKPVQQSVDEDYIDEKY